VPRPNQMIKNDDGEAGAGMVILRMLESEGLRDHIVVLTRWFGTAAPARAQNAGDSDAVAGPPLRFSAKRKLAAVQRLLRGEPLEKVSRELNVPVHRLSEWRDRAL
jgi:hypothetical protein